MAEWREQDLIPFSSVKGALQAVSGVATTMQGAMTAVQSALNAYQLLVPGALLSVDTAIRALFGTITGALVDLLQCGGVYCLTVYPQRVDYGRARLLEQVEAQEDVVTRLQAELERIHGAPVLVNPRRQVSGAANEGRWRAEESGKKSAELASAIAALHRLRHQYVFSASGLATGFTWTEFLSTFEASLTDRGDYSKPQFSTNAAVTGVVVVAASNSVTDFAAVVEAFASWRGHRGLQRQSRMLSRLLDGSGRRTTAETPHRPPDWEALTLAKALGIEQQIDALKRAGNAMGLAALGGANPSVKRALDFVGDITAAWTDVGALAQTLLAGLAATGALSGKARVLLIPPIEGGRVTAGMEGFLATMRDTPGPPTERWVIGTVLLGGFPMGIDVSQLTAQIMSSGSVSNALSQAQALYGALKGPF